MVLVFRRVGSTLGSGYGIIFNILLPCVREVKFH